MKKKNDSFDENDNFENDENNDKNDSFDLSMFDIVKSSSVVFVFEKTKKIYKLSNSEVLTNNKKNVYEK